MHVPGQRAFSIYCKYAMMCNFCQHVRFDRVFGRVFY